VACVVDLERALPVGRNENPVARAAQHPFHIPSHRLLILRDRTIRCRRLGIRGSEPPLVRGSVYSRQVDAEDRAVARLAMDVDEAATLLNDPDTVDRPRPSFAVPW